MFVYSEDTSVGIKIKKYTVQLKKTKLAAVCQKMSKKNHSMSGCSVSKAILFDVSFIKIG
jgi:hypothetical protein